MITFASGKGGTGKTTVVANVGVALAQLGLKVVILDADIAMANLGLMLGLEGQKTTLHEVLAGEASVSKVIAEGPKGVKVVPSGVSFDGIKKAKLDHLKEVVSELSEKFDFLLIDSPSGLDRDAVTVLTSGKEMVIVTTPDIASLSNALRVKVVGEQLGVKPIGVVVTRATGGREDVSKNGISSMLELPLLATIPEDPEVRCSTACGEPVVLRSPKSPAAKGFQKLASALARSGPPR